MAQQQPMCLDLLLAWRSVSSLLNLEVLESSWLLVLNSDKILLFLQTT